MKVEQLGAVPIGTILKYGGMYYVVKVSDTMTRFINYKDRLSTPIRVLEASTYQRLSFMDSDLEKNKAIDYIEENFKVLMQYIKPKPEPILIKGKLDTGFAKGKWEKASPAFVKYNYA